MRVSEVNPRFVSLRLSQDFRTSQWKHLASFSCGTNSWYFIWCWHFSAAMTSSLWSLSVDTWREIWEKRTHERVWYAEKYMKGREYCLNTPLSSLLKRAYHMSSQMYLKVSHCGYSMVAQYYNTERRPVGHTSQHIPVLFITLHCCCSN